MPSSNHAEEMHCPLDEASIDKWKFKEPTFCDPKTVVCVLKDKNEKLLPVNSPGHGLVKPIAKLGDALNRESVLFHFEPCIHNVVIKDLCAQCGANLRRQGGYSGDRVHPSSANIPMVHSMPELHVSEKVAEQIASQDERNLLKNRKLVLLVDLDMTVIHSTTDNRAFRFKNVLRYRLANSPIVYHTRMRPHLDEFLQRVSKLFELHICTFGNRMYAHQLASLIDPEKKYFSHRILSRDECFNPITKAANLKALFPRGVHMVCIIDDRGDVWDWSPNLILVQPFRFFPETGDINAPTGLPTVNTKSAESTKSDTKKVSGSDSEKTEMEKAIAIVEAEEKTLDDLDNGYLLALERILNSIHKEFYTRYDSNLYRARESGEIKATDTDARFRSEFVPDVATIMNELRKKILGPRCRITMSGLVHSHKPVNQSFLGKVVLMMGAVLHSGLRLPHSCLELESNSVHCSDSELNKKEEKRPANSESKSDGEFKLPLSVKRTAYTTHLVACRRDTEKVRAATSFLKKLPPGRSPPLRVVNAHWLWACFFRWERARADRFPLHRDYHRSDFDPTAEPSPGSPRHLHRVMKRQLMEKHRGHSSHPNKMRFYDTQISSNASSVTAPAAPAASTPVSASPEPQLNKSLVLSSLLSIQQELNQERKQKRQRKRKRVTDEERDSAEASSSSSASELSSLSSHTASSNNDRLSETETGKEGGGKNDEDEAMHRQMEQLLKKPRKMILADNPLMHMPPRAATEMLSEIEDALLEEQTEACKASVPEAEVYDPAQYEATSSTDATGNEDMAATPQRRVRRRRLCRRERLRRELLLRRRNRASAEELDTINRRLRSIRGRYRRRRASSLPWGSDNAGDSSFHSTSDSDSGSGSGASFPKRNQAKLQGNIILETSEESDTIKHSSTDEEAFWNADCPRGWQHRKLDGLPDECTYYTFNSPHIHSDPGLGDDGEWNTCPEGYDYQDAEAARRLLRPQLEMQSRGPINLGSCLASDSRPRENATDSSSDTSSSLDGQGIEDEEIVDEFLQQYL